MKEKIYKLSEFSELVNLHPNSLQRLDREKKLIAYRTATNRRYYTEKHYKEYFNLENI